MKLLVKLYNLYGCFCDAFVIASSALADTELSNGFLNLIKLREEEIARFDKLIWKIEY